MAHLFQKPAAGDQFVACPDSEQWGVYTKENKTERDYDDNLDNARKIACRDDSANDQSPKGGYSKSEIVFPHIALI